MMCDCSLAKTLQIAQSFIFEDEAVIFSLLNLYA
jgi:hypothetical protein